MEQQAPVGDPIVVKDLVAGRKHFLTVCEGGNCRSVSLARVLKVHHGQEAIAIGWRYATPWVWSTLGDWADYIVLMETSFQSHVPEHLKPKMRVLDVGIDIYGVPTHPMLYGYCYEAAKSWSERNFEL